MNIKRIRNIIHKEKEKYMNDNNNIESFSKNFQTDSFGSIYYYLGNVITLVSFFFLVCFSYHFVFSSSFYDQLSKNIIINFIQVLFIPIFGFGIPIFWGVSAFAIWEKINGYRSKKIFSKAKNEEERKNLTKTNFNELFNKTEVSDYLLNELKVHLSKEEYVNFRTSFPGKITYKELQEFLSEKQRIENIHKEQESITMTTEQIELYKNNI